MPTQRQQQPAAAAATNSNKATRESNVIIGQKSHLQKKKQQPTMQKPSSPPESQLPPPTQPTRQVQTTTTPTEPDAITPEARVIQALRRLFKVLGDSQFNSECEIERQRRRQCQHDSQKKQQQRLADNSAIDNRNRNLVATTTAAATTTATPDLPGHLVEKGTGNQLRNGDNDLTAMTTTTTAADTTTTTAFPRQRQQQQQQQQQNVNENGSTIDNNSSSHVATATAATAESLRRLRDSHETEVPPPPPHAAHHKEKSNTTSNKKKRAPSPGASDPSHTGNGNNNSRKKIKITAPTDTSPIVAQTGTSAPTPPAAAAACLPSASPQQKEPPLSVLPARFPPRLTTTLAIEAATMAASVSAYAPGKGSSGETATTDDSSGKRQEYQERWNIRYQELADFKEKHKHLNVPPPHKDKTFMTLYWWIILQKTEWRKFAKGLKSRLDEKQIKRLILIGLGTCDGPADKFARAPNVAPSAAWNARFEQLLKFKRENGHVEVPEKKGEGKSDLRDLARWANKQRKQFANRQHKATHGTKKDSSSGTMTDIQLTKLASIGFRFTNKVLDWDTRFQHLEQYKTLHGNTRVPKAYSGFCNLGDWVMGLRHRYKLNKLSPERIARLEAIGFEWKLRDRRPKVPKASPKH